ncbi:glycosyltransferase family 9 protein [Foetidibacter luteolus]|uniref:glycosyltransferase family 9 protein n=1 Tax=Foetidibacter luteolus TaxID=2608880 RepID=UPI00129B8C5C|nr:glycosyltransferase family 9 protein [Foetidibacter luteolus]
MKFLIIRFSSIGDIVLTTPVIRCLKQQVADAEVHYLTKKSFGGILSSNPYIDKVHLLAEDWNNMIGELTNEQFDYIIDLHHNLRTSRVKKALKVKSYSFNKLNMEKWLLTALKIDLLPHVHIVDRYLDTLKDFGVINDGRGLDYFIPQQDVVPPDHLPTSHQLGFIGIVTGAALATKKLPVEKLKQLCTLIKHPIILLGGPEDSADAEQIAAVDNVKIYNACGKFNLNESADLVRKAKLIITHDTGLMHIAAAFKKPVISIWGNTIPGFGMDAYFGTYEVQNTKHEVKNLYCRPCSKIGYRRCPQGHFLCMQKQDIPAIAAEAMQLLSKKS